MKEHIDLQSDQNNFLVFACSDPLDKKMRVLHSFLTAGILALSATQALAASWTFTDATVSVQSKGTGVGGTRKDK